MKVLSLALIALGGFAGSAMAACPAGPDAAHGGAWTDVYQVGGTATVVSPGYASTECRLNSAINTGAGSSATGSVYWASTPATPEPRYRAQFIINTDAITSTVSADGVSVYSASSGAGGDGVSFSIFGNGGAMALGYAVRYNDASGLRYRTGSVPLGSGEVHVEFDLQVASTAGATDGSFKLWVQNNNEATPSKVETGLANFGLGGIDNATLGLAGPTPAFVLHFATKGVGFDQYDSRRQTFIGY
jgi:hypothetical protein